MSDTPDSGVRTDGVDDLDDLQPNVEGTVKKEDSGKLEKRVKDQENHIRKLQSDLDKSKSEGSKTNDILQALTDNVTAQNKTLQPDPKEDVESFVERVSETIDTDTKQGVRELLGVMSNWIEQSEKTAATARKEALKALSDEMGVSVSELKSKLIEQDPEAKEYGDAAKKLAELSGSDFKENRELFLNLAKAQGLSSKKERHDLPGGITGTSVVGDDGEFVIGDFERSRGFDKFPKDVQKRLTAKWKKEASR